MSQIKKLVPLADDLDEFETTRHVGQYFLFFPTTTGLNKPKKSKGFPTFESALSAGNTLNLMDGRHDRIFCIIKDVDIKAFTPETGEIPFRNDMFRFNTLGSGANKFNPAASAPAGAFNQNFQVTNLQSPIVHIPSLTIDPNKPISDSLLEIGFNKELLSPLQNLIQSELGISKLDHSPTQEELNAFYILKELLSLPVANEKIFQVIMETMKGNFDLSIFNLPSGE